METIKQLLKDLHKELRREINEAVNKDLINEVNKIENEAERNKKYFEIQDEHFTNPINDIDNQVIKLVDKIHDDAREMKAEIKERKALFQKTFAELRKAEKKKNV